MMPDVSTINPAKAISLKPFGALDYLKWSLTYEGVTATSLIVCAKLLARVGIHVNQRQWYWQWRGRCFDRRFNVATTNEVSREDLDIATSMKHLVVHYSPTPPTGFGLTLSGLGIDYSQYTFVDYGCGRGRTLVMARAFPFHEIIGLELSPALAAQASQNLTRANLLAGRCNNACVLQTDASQWQLPDGPAVLYFFNPFGEELMCEALRNIAASFAAEQRHLVVIYYNPVHRLLFDNADFLSAVPIADQAHACEWAVYETRM